MTIFIKPKNGLKILRPDNGRFLRPEGEKVPNTTFWRRRIFDGDVIETKQMSASKESHKITAPKQAPKIGGEK